jgi:Response regulator containing a CheY-like receiver domain and an HTH DNA-binding domain
MSSEAKIHVVIAHGNPLVSAGLEAGFHARTDFMVADAPDSVVITDCELGMSLLTGKDGGRRRVLILTDEESEICIRSAMQRGVRGYLPLSSCIESVVRAVRCIHNGGIAIAPAVAAKMALSLRSPTLSGREIEVLRMIMQGSPDKVIARNLQRSIATAKSHVKAILCKLGAASRVEAVAIARRRGLVPKEPRTALMDDAIPRSMPEFPMLS